MLDPSLDALVRPLNDAYLESLRSSRGQYQTIHRKDEQKICLPQALSIMLYTLCKVRGSKVIVRFLSNEARFLELILDAIETWSKSTSERQPDDAPLKWEERYILLLWLSHLLLTPFDLSTIGSEDGVAGNMQFDKVDGLELPTDLPSIARRLLSLAIDNLSSASKERESAILILVRLGLRPDMQRLDLPRILIQWAVSQLKTLAKSKTVAGYLFIGLLSFLAAFIKSADATIVGPFLIDIFSSVEQLQIMQSGSSTALTRIAVIKISKACSTAALILEEYPDEDLHMAAQILESVIDELLSALADNDTPVRQSASKALSAVAVKLDPAMSADISEAVISGLQENVLWELSSGIAHVGSGRTGRSIKQRNLTLVNPSKWQGLVLTLSYLLFRQCPPVAQLPAILNSLALALSFERRSPTGASLGTNVRDAACFGIWAIARRYSTADLLLTDIDLIPAAKERGCSSTVMQFLSIELLVAATLDPAGNIRRGASAALQELIGRHPDTILHGISLVQIVDYHAVALRSRAMQDIAVSAARLDDQYLTAILHELTTWRGIGANDVESRRLAADTIGILSLFNGLHSIRSVIQNLWYSLGDLDGNTVQKRQGVLLAISTIVRAASQIPKVNQEEVREIIFENWTLIADGTIFTIEDLNTHTARPELMNEAVALLIFELATAVTGSLKIQLPSEDILQKCFQYLGIALERNETIVIEHAINALEVLFEIAGPGNRTIWIEQSLARAKYQKGSSSGTHGGHLLALASLHRSDHLDGVTKEKIIDTLTSTATAKIDIDTRVVALEGITKVISGTPPNQPIQDTLTETIRAALQDYHTDQRGDVGSLLRLEAINTVKAAFERGTLQVTEGGMNLLQFVCILAGERLDKVRARAWDCLATCWRVDLSPVMASEYPPYATRPGNSDIAGNFDVRETSTIAYYHGLLQLFQYQSLRVPILQGIFVSVGGGSDSILVASRSALMEWLQHDLPTSDLETFGAFLEIILERSLKDDRILIPALESVAFILETNTFTEKNSPLLRYTIPLKPTPHTNTSRHRKIFTLAQKSHFKTSSIPKLLAAIEVYIGLGTTQSIRNDVLKKLTALLTHPYPRVCFLSLSAQPPI